MTKRPSWETRAYARKGGVSHLYPPPRLSTRK